MTMSSTDKKNFKIHLLNLLAAVDNKIKRHSIYHFCFHSNEYIFLWCNLDFEAKHFKREKNTGAP